jgi:hypothetical protein
VCLFSPGNRKGQFAGKAERGTFLCASIADDDTVYLGSQEGYVYVWTGAVLGYSFQAHAAGVSSITVAGQLLITGADDGAITTWNRCGVCCVCG